MLLPMKTSCKGRYMFHTCETYSVAHTYTEFMNCNRNFRIKVIELLVENMKNWRLLLHVPVEIINNC